EFWEDLGSLMEARPSADPARYREKVTSLTTAYLGLEGARADAFDRTSGAALAQIGRAWKARDDAILAMPAWVGPDERQRKASEIQERYQDAKRAEVDRIEALLDATPRHY